MSETASTATPSQPDVARFGAALPRDADELSADENTARYRVFLRFEALRGFYEAVYGKTDGVLLEDLPAPPPKPRERNPATPGFAVVASPKLRDAEWSMIVVQKAPVKDSPLAHDVLIVARGDEDLGGYPDPSPWMRKPPRS
ncbi:MAG: hypothetical protein RIT45_362 [Pseudomonadota bacterium]|jgi:hypothetical protein